MGWLTINIPGDERKDSPDRQLEASFRSNHYLRHNARRLEHLASLNIPVANRSVLEVGAGIGDHSHFYLDRGCTVTITDARPELVEYLQRRYPDCRVLQLDLDAPRDVPGYPFDIVHCYGALYHSSRPESALEFLGTHTRQMMFVETCVSFGDDEQIHRIEEPHDLTQSYSGFGCRPTRAWVIRELKRHFEYVYLPLTQPCHEEFPLDWSAPDAHTAPYQRAVFIASRHAIENDQLTTHLPQVQRRMA